MLDKFIEKSIWKAYCNDITLRPALASGSDQDKNAVCEILEGNFCRMPVYMASASNTEKHLMEPEMLSFFTGNVGQTLRLNPESRSIGGISPPAPGWKSKSQFPPVTEQLRWAQTIGSKIQKLKSILAKSQTISVLS